MTACSGGVGKEPIAIDGCVRRSIEDSDTLTLRGHARGDGHIIGFGDGTGQVIPGPANPYARKGWIMTRALASEGNPSGKAIGFAEFGSGGVALVMC